MACIYLSNTIEPTTEYLAAKTLKELLARDLRNIEGEIWLIPSVDIHPATGRHDIDLIMIGHLDNFHTDIASYREIEVKSFFTTIEIKSHSADGICKEGTHLLVRYPNGTEDVTRQSNDQKESIRRFLSGPLAQIGTRVPFITNIIWLTGITQDDFNNSVNLPNSNILASDSSVDDIFQAIGRQSKLRDYGFVSAFAKDVTQDDIKHISDIFYAKRNGADSMTLRRINLLQEKNNILNNLESNNSKIIILSGHAGTGKTIMLLREAYDLTNKGYKCLFITYNTALIADLKHTLQFIKPTPTFELQSMHSLMIGLLGKAGLWNKSKDISKDFSQAVSARLRSKREFDQLSYDYIFIDEAQDWKQEEAELLLRHCKNAHIVIADGIDQFMYAQDHTNWGSQTLPKLNICLRQRSNLVYFVKTFASKLGIYWDVEASRNLPGGKVIITHKYDRGLHEQLYTDTLSHGCTAYDIMILAPKSLTTSGHFDLADAYRHAGINIYDGIDKEQRHKIYGKENYDNNECRIYTYESCRGLESWVTICLRFDQLFSEEHPHDYRDIPYSAARQYMLGLWTMMPLTRAIDTLVLVTKEWSYIDGILKEIADINSDYIIYK